MEKHTLGGYTKANLERKRCADGHKNDDFDTTTASMFSKGYDVKILRFTF